MKDNGQVIMIAKIVAEDTVVSEEAQQLIMMLWKLDQIMADMETLGAIEWMEEAKFDLQQALKASLQPEK